MTYRLYNRIGSGRFVVEAALALADAPVDLVDLDSRTGTPLPREFQATNPWRQVPTLIMPDGTTMTESAAILIHLAACHPDKGLAPVPGTSAHAQFLRWMIFTSVNVYEAVLRTVYPFRYTSEPDATEATRVAAIERMGEALSVLEAAVDRGPYMLGRSMSVLDVYVAMLLVWFKGEIEAPRLTALTQGVRTHPVVGPVWRRHFGDR